MSEQKNLEIYAKEILSEIKKSLATAKIDFEQNEKDFVLFARQIAELNLKILKEGNTSENSLALANAELVWKIRALRMANKYQSNSANIVESILNLAINLALQFAVMYTDSISRKI